MAANLAAHARATNGSQSGSGTFEESLADPISPQSLLGKPAPPLEVERWLGQKPAIEGKPLLIWFWAPWSTPCRKAIPELNALQKKFAGKVAVVAVTSASESEIANQAGATIDCPSALDSKAKLCAAAGVTSIPCVLLTDAKGIVRYQGHPGALTERALQALLTAMDHTDQ